MGLLKDYNLHSLWIGHIAGKCKVFSDLRLQIDSESFFLQTSARNSHSANSLEILDFLPP